MDPLEEMYLTNMLMSAYQTHANANPNQTPQKMTPEQKQIYDIYYKSLINPAFQGNAALVNKVATGVVSGGPPHWTPLKTSTGLTGYDAKPAFDWGGYLGAPGGASGPAPVTPNPAGGTATSPASGVPSPSVPGSSGLDSLPQTSASSNTSLVPPTSLQDAATRYGKPVAELLSSFLSMNPVLGLKGAWDAYQAWKSGGAQPGNVSTLPPPDMKPVTAADVAPATWGTGISTPTPATVSYSDNPWNTPGFQSFYGGGGNTPVTYDPGQGPTGRVGNLH